MSEPSTQAGPVMDEEWMSDEQALSLAGQYVNHFRAFSQIKLVLSKYHAARGRLKKIGEEILEADKKKLEVINDLQTLSDELTSKREELSGMIAGMHARYDAETKKREEELAEFEAEMANRKESVLAEIHVEKAKLQKELTLMSEEFVSLQQNVINLRKKRNEIVEKMNEFKEFEE